MYNNPYNYYPYMNMPRGMTVNPYLQGSSINGIQNIVRPRAGLFKGLSGIKWGTILNNTQKTLNVINQAIPVYYQIKPIFTNVRSLGKLISAFNTEDSSKDFSNNINEMNVKKENKNSPTFFIN